MITSRYATLHDIDLILDEAEKGNAETRWKFTLDVSDGTSMTETDSDQWHGGRDLRGTPDPSLL